MYAAKACLHKWEEPCISYKNGAGTIFFSGCNLHCVYCQNSAISNKYYGKPLTVARLADVMLELQDKGADNIELVTPTHFVPVIISALDIARPKLKIPVIYNTGGYESVDTIDLLDGYIDVYLPDIKFFSSDVSGRYSSAPDYFDFASEAVLRMTGQTGNLRFNDEGGLIKGTLIRHLVLPGQRHDSMKIIRWISDNLDSGTYLLSIMSQYTPPRSGIEKYRELDRHITKMEYNSVTDLARKLNISGYTQDITSSDSAYIPDFDGSGI